MVNMTDDFIEAADILNAAMARYRMKGKELMIVDPRQLKPQYGGRTLIEKVTAYKLSGGEIVEGKKNALKRQKDLDLRARVDVLINDYFEPFRAKGEDHVLPSKVVDVWTLKHFLFVHKEWIDRLN